ncbi:MAG: RNA 2',3'-cyclic phosphodiesterase [Patescibacteria group bacterium]|nr:RNA 2',3'-cyclic phosphodiesterase [Patescibacteria group bacterium]
MTHRIFIAINLPEKIKAKMIDFQSKWPELPVKWVKRNNLHITLIFLGNIPEKEIPEILEITDEITQKYNPFSINLNKIVYAPPKKIPPKMVWVAGEKSEELERLYKDLENSLFVSPFKESLKPQSRPYSPHVTLGRINQWEFKRIEPEERPEIKEEVYLKFEVNSIEIMESRLRKTGAEYTILKSYSLQSE